MNITKLSYRGFRPSLQIETLPEPLLRLPFHLPANQASCGFQSALASTTVRFSVDLQFVLPQVVVGRDLDLVPWPERHWLRTLRVRRYRFPFLAIDTCSSVLTIDGIGLACDLVVDNDLQVQSSVVPNSSQPNAALGAAQMLTNAVLQKSACYYLR
jgi:hypothetical protein